MCTLFLSQQFPRLLLSHPLTLTSILVFLSAIVFLSSHTKKHRLPPSPPKLPVLGNLHNLSSLPHRSLDSLSNKYGPLMLLRLGRVPTLVVSSPGLAREVMKEQDHKFATRPSLTIPRKILYQGRDIAFAPYGEYWRQVRKISFLHLLSARKVMSYRRIREEEVANMIDRILSGTGHVNVSKALNTLTKDVISRVMLGDCARDERWSDVIGEMIEETSELLGAFHWGDYVPWLAWASALTGLDSRVTRVFKEGNEFLERIVETRRKVLEEEGSKESNVFVDILLSLEKDLNSSSFPFVKENIKAIVEDMFGAGTDSTYIVMEWAMAELLRNPEAMRKLKEEIRGTVGSRAVVTEDDLTKMTYLKAVIKETLRLHPPGPLLVPRELMEDTELQGYHVPKHTRVLVNVWTIGRDPNVWDTPEEFRPERFFSCGGSDTVDFTGHDFRLVPFGSGRRICPGIQFAVAIIELGVANLVHRFDWKLPVGEEDLDMMEAPGLTCRKKIKLSLVASACLYNP